MPSSIKRKPLVSVIIYLLLGVVGLPVFAEASSGMDKMRSGSGGFLYGFIFAGYVMSFWNVDSETSLQKWTLTLQYVMIATAVLFFFGLTHLTMLFGFQPALEYGLYPFWIPALIKVLLVTTGIVLLSGYIKK